MGSGVILTGRFMEVKFRKTTKNPKLKVVVLWVKNGMRGQAFDCVDWDNQIDDSKVGSVVSVMVASSVTSGKNGRVFENYAVQSPIIALPKDVVESCLS